MDERSAREPTRGEPPPEEELLAPGLVHELRQPLTGLDAGLRLVERELGASVTELDGWKIATSQLARVREMLDSYQRLMSSDAGDHAPFAVEPIVRRAVEGLRHRGAAAPDGISVHVERDVPHAYGSPQALLHALTNVLANALDAVAETRKPGRIEVRVLRAVDVTTRARIRIADEGAGIPPERRRQLFRPGFTTKGPGRGSGLGLAVARRMLRRAGGELRLALPGEPSACPWARTEFVVDLAAAADAPAPREPSARRPAPLWGAVPPAALAAALILALALGWGGFRRWVRTGDAAPAAAAAAMAAPVVEVLTAEGRIERRRGDAWEAVAKGQRLLPEDTIRAGAGSGATLGVGERSRLVVADATELTVREITAAVQRLQLSRGRISVDHQPDGARVLVVESARGDSVARAGTARFSVLASGTALAVATQAGVVRLKSAGEEVEVATGEQSVSFGGQVPTKPAPVPMGLLLRIARATRDARGSCTVGGAAVPGVEVRVDGTPVAPGPDGTFAVRLTRAPGRRATVVTRDAAGRVEERRVDCGEPRVSDFAVRWGQDGPVPKPE